MMNMKKRTAAVAVVMSMMLMGAVAEVSFEGKIGASGTECIYTPVGGTIESVEVEVGEYVHEGDAIATVETTKVYATEDGTITGIFGQPGDAASSVIEKYGAVLYIEGDSLFTIAASTDKAYNSTATKTVHVGEDVYLRGYDDSSCKGKGRIISIQGTDYTVRVTEGEFIIGDSVNVYRDSSYSNSKRIGRGDASRTSPTAVSANGSITSFAVKEGDAVKRGDLLFETVNGSFDGLYMSGNSICAEEEGVISEIAVQVGGSIQEKSVIARYYPKDAMRVEATVSEYDLNAVKEGDEVEIELMWNRDDGVTYPGTVKWISAVAAENNGGGDVGYTAYIDFTPDENTRYGMSAEVKTID